VVGFRPPGRVIVVPGARLLGQDKSGNPCFLDTAILSPHGILHDLTTASDGTPFCFDETSDLVGKKKGTLFFDETSVFDYCFDGTLCFMDFDVCVLLWPANPRYRPRGFGVQVCALCGVGRETDLHGVPARCRQGLQKLHKNRGIWPANCTKPAMRFRAYMGVAGRRGERSN
jgi:hypothetical protein